MLAFFQPTLRGDVCLGGLVEGDRVVLLLAALCEGPLLAVDVGPSRGPVASVA
jgi:hypothetical protein